MSGLLRIYFQSGKSFSSQQLNYPVASYVSFTCNWINENLMCALMKHPINTQ